MMRLRSLHEALGRLVAAGYGDHPVMDRDGNDVAEVVAPPRPVRKPRHDEAHAIILRAYIDVESWDR